MGEYKQALASLIKLLKFEINNAFALRYRGETYYIMKRYKEQLALKAHEEVTSGGYTIVYF